MPYETCANCGASIGDLETPHVWRDKVVCASCYQRLIPTPPKLPSAVPIAQPAPVMPVGGIICPNPRCGYIGPPFMQRKGSTGLGCLLMLLFVLPGLLYLIFTRGYRYCCPRCGLHIRSD